MKLDSNTSLEIVQEQIARIKETRIQEREQEKKEKHRAEIRAKNQELYRQYIAKGNKANHEKAMQRMAERRKEQLTRMEEITEKTPEIEMLQELLSWGVVDYKEPEKVAERFNQYLTKCKAYEIKPGIEGMCLSMGMARHTYDSIRNGKIKAEPQTVAVFKQIHQYLTAEMEYYMLHGKVNPVVAIFIAKNCYGYKDSVEQVITQEDKQKLDAESIRERYLLEEK